MLDGHVKKLKILDLTLCTNPEYLKVNIQVEQEAFLLGLINKQLEKNHGTLYLCIIIVVGLLSTQRWQDLTLHNKGMDDEDDGTYWGGQIDHRKDIK